MASVDLSIVPADVTIVNISTAIKSIQGFKTNLTIKIPAGDTVVLVAEDSLALAYYYSLAVSGEVTVAAEASA